MTAVALPMTEVGSSVTGSRDVPGATGFTVHVGLDDAGATTRERLADVAQAVLQLVAEMAPDARTEASLEGASASRRAEIAWQPREQRPQVVLDADARQLTVGGDPVALTYKELALLEYLVHASHRAVSRAELLETVWRSATSAEGTRTIDVHVRRLRKKLGGFVQIVTVRGVGYRCDLTPEVVLVGSGDAG